MLPISAPPISLGGIARLLRKVKANGGWFLVPTSPRELPVWLTLHFRL